MSETREQIQKQIQDQGDLVRKLKSAKESPEKVCDFRNIIIIYSFN